MRRSLAYAEAHRYPEQRDRTIWQVFEEERSGVVHYAEPFDGFHYARPRRQRPARPVLTATNTPSVDYRTNLIHFFILDGSAHTARKCFRSTP